VQEKKYLARIYERVSLEDWDEITDQAIRDAKDGDRHARQWLSDYCLGKPSQQGPLVDNRQVTFDLSNVSEERLRAAIQLAQLVNAPGRASEEDVE
jgi:hypothetical protein